MTSWALSERLGPDMHARTAYVLVQESAFSGQLYLRWEGTHGGGFAMRINPRGPDLEEALAEWTKNCRRAAGID